MKYDMLDRISAAQSMSDEDDESFRNAVMCGLRQVSQSFCMVATTDVTLASPVLLGRKGFVYMPDTQRLVMQQSNGLANSALLSCHPSQYKCCHAHILHPKSIMQPGGSGHETFKHRSC